MKKILLLLAFFICGNIYSQTTINHNIFADTTWTLAGSPYHVTINVVIFDGVTLTIDPGVEVKFDSACEMDLRGKLIAIGTATDSIMFTSSSPNPTMGIWKGIQIRGQGSPVGAGNQLRMEYCKGMYAYRFVDMDIAYHGPYIFEHCLFFENNVVNWDGGTPTVYFSDCNFISNYTGLGYAQFGGIVRKSVFLYNTLGVDGFSNVDTCYFAYNTQIALSAYGAAVGNTVENNDVGVDCMFNSVNDTFMYNIVRNNNIGVILRTYFNGSIHFTKNSICNNSQYNIKLMTANNADLSDNCWCETYDPAIRNLIFDGYVNSSFGLVNFSPVADSCPTEPMGIHANPMQPVNELFSVYPNPSNGIFYFKNYESGNSQLEIYDVYGKLIYSSFITSQTSEIDLSNEAKGIYFLRLVSNEKAVTKRIIVE
jgi:hypothetical protein